MSTVSAVTALAAVTVLCALAYIPLRRRTFKAYLRQDLDATTGGDQFQAEHDYKRLNRKQRCLGYTALACYAVNCFLLSALPKESSLGGWSVLATTVAALTVIFAALHYGGEETEHRYEKDRKSGSTTESPCKHKR